MKEGERIFNMEMYNKGRFVLCFNCPVEKKRFTFIFSEGKDFLGDGRFSFKVKEVKVSSSSQD